MLNLELINIGADTILMLVIATFYRMSLLKQVRLEEKIANTLSKSETKELIEEEIERHISVIKHDIASINNILSQIAEVTLKGKVN